MEWAFADGTRITDAGLVTGDSAFAAALRADVELVRKGRPVLAFRATMPGIHKLDLADPELVDGWLRSQAARFDVEIDTAPAFDARPVAAAVDDERVY